MLIRPQHVVFRSRFTLSEKDEAPQIDQSDGKTLASAGRRFAAARPLNTSRSAFCYGHQVAAIPTSCPRATNVGTQRKTRNVWFK